MSRSAVAIIFKGPILFRWSKALHASQVPQRVLSADQAALDGDGETYLGRKGKVGGKEPYQRMVWRDLFGHVLMMKKTTLWCYAPARRAVSPRRTRKTLLQHVVLNAEVVIERWHLR